MLIAMQGYAQPGMAPFVSDGPRTFHPAAPPGYVGPLPPGQYMGGMQYADGPMPMSQQIHPWPPRRSCCNCSTIAVSILAGLTVALAVAVLLKRSGQGVQATPAPMPGQRFFQLRHRHWPHKLNPMWFQQLRILLRHRLHSRPRNLNPKWLQRHLPAARRKTCLRW